MKKRRSPSEIQALAASRRRSLLFVGVGIIIAIIVNALSSEFLALQCVVLAAITLGGALSCAWAAVAIDPVAAPRAGMQAGMLTAMAYVLPFALVALYRFLTLDEVTAARLAGEMSAAQATSLVQQNITPGLEYFRGQYVSYIFGYVLFGLLFGWALGALGGVFARRTAQ
jgi:hypothetical protein